MAFELNTKVSVGDTYGKQKLGNLTLEDAKFWGRPNFSGDPEADRFKDPRRKFTIQIPNEVADELRNMGWNVKTTIPENEDQEPISSLKVMIDEDRSDVWVIMGEEREKLTKETMGLLDRSRIDNLDMEIRAWEYNPEEHPDEYSARLVTLVAVIRPNLLAAKYGRLLG